MEALPALVDEKGIDMNTIKIELNETMLEKLVRNYLQNKLGDIEIREEDIKIQVKSKQNYKSEWENASYRAIYENTNFGE